MIEIRTLGRTSISVDGEPLTGEAAWPKSLALIVYMAREPGPDRREEILGVLWPDRDEKRARRALNQLLYTLRKATPQLDLESVEDAVDFGSDVWLDVEEFERRIEEGDLKSAVEMYRGPFLADLAFGEPEFDHWADRQRAGLGRKFRKAALQLATEAKEASDPKAAVSYCRLLIGHDPLDDEAQHLLIECLYLRGDRLEALRQYDKYRDLLASELEVEPLEHTRELVARIRAEPVPGAPVNDAASEPVEERDVPRPPPEPMVTESGPTAEDGAAARVSPLRDRRWLMTLGAVAVVAVSAILIWPRTEGAGDLGATADAVSAASGLRVAVLPFRIHGSRPDSEGLADGVAQLLSLDLDGQASISTVGHLQVLQAVGDVRADVAPRDVLSMRQLAGDLGATAFVVGDIHRAGNDVRIVAEMIDAQTGALLGRADARGPRDGLFDLIDQLIVGLVEAVAGADSDPESSEAPDR
ncbi:MAG TPA: BTAD domain-containing putative transcriptional regulator [Gemmatimonadota bacterium]|nr:BTAD domain-containing putative transcriptional regulator [Gemmatimonadota bacterium]